ncbi:MAG: L-aspartate oxidase, partial [Coriobacteriales bacterium]
MEENGMLQLKEKYDIIIAGAGVAGLNAALFLPRDKDILLISKESPKHSDSYLAQGGICVLKWDGDHDIFFEDTLRAGHYENNRDTVECMLRSSRETISDLLCAGVRFSTDKEGNFLYTREGGHRAKRIMYHEDCTGREITSRLYAQAKKLKNVHIRPYTALIDLLCDERENVCAGAVLRDEETGEIKAVSADYVILATGGVGGLFRFSTNYRNLTGDGVAVCLKHGVEVENVDYIQIHPTTLYTKKRGRRFLISESVRGEGAVLLGADGQRFTDELQPRDVVAAAIYAQMEKDGADHVLLDLRTISPDIVRAHFPAIVRRCAEEGYDVFNAPIPVVPSQHYFMGGVKSDLEGKTSMSRLFAVGETCCNGVHGKNRLASNSLLESLVFAKRAALRIA